MNGFKFIIGCMIIFTIIVILMVIFNPKPKCDKGEPLYKQICTKGCYYEFVGCQIQ